MPNELQRPYAPKQKRNMALLISGAGPHMHDAEVIAVAMLMRTGHGCSLSPACKQKHQTRQQAWGNDAGT